MTDVEELKESQRHVEAKLNDLIAHNPALRRAHALAEIENLRARHYQTLLKLVVLQKMITADSRFPIPDAADHENRGGRRRAQRS